MRRCDRELAPQNGALAARSSLGRKKLLRRAGRLDFRERERPGFPRFGREPRGHETRICMSTVAPSAMGRTRGVGRSGSQKTTAGVLHDSASPQNERVKVRSGRRAFSLPRAFAIRCKGRLKAVGSDSGARIARSRGRGRRPKVRPASPRISQLLPLFSFSGTFES
jgi:hypothetical protein